MPLIKKQTGIVKEITKGGEERYTPVAKIYVLGVLINTSGIRVHGEGLSIEQIMSEDYSQPSMAKAREEIDQYLHEITEEKRKREAKKIVTTKFIKYP